MTPSLLQIAWLPRPVPLTPIACAGIGPVARNLANRLLRLDDSELARYRGAAGKGVLLLSGETEILPWTDGVLYLGRDPAAPELLLPTALAPSISPALLVPALRRAFPDTAPPLAVFPETRQIISLNAAGPVSRQRLLLWLESSLTGP